MVGLPSTLGSGYGSYQTTTFAILAWPEAIRVASGTFAIATVGGVFKIENQRTPSAANATASIAIGVVSTARTKSTRHPPLLCLDSLSRLWTLVVFTI